MPRMDPTCTDCGHDGLALHGRAASSALRREVTDLVHVLRDRQQTTPWPAGSWSALDYAGSIRDILLVAREHTLQARSATSPVVSWPDVAQRADWGEYDRLSTSEAAAEIAQAARRLGDTWERLSTTDWNRTLRYAADTDAVDHDLSRLAARIVHEVIHHRLAVERATIVRKVVSVDPDYGSPWGLWSNNPPYPPERAQLLTPENFGLPPAVVTRLRSWLDAWTENFADAPADAEHTWRREFDVDGWIREGVVICDLIGEALPDSTVQRRFQTYARYRRR